MNEKIVILGTAHLSTTPGKASPDGMFREYAYSRKVVTEIAAELRQRGVRVFIDYISPDPSEQMRGATWRQEQSRELAYRAGFVNALCSKYGKENCLYVSVHNNAAGGDGKWHTARGFSVFVTPRCSQASRTLARELYEQAEAHGTALTGNRAVPPSKMWESNLYVLNKTVCPAVLTENLFQDNREDVAFMQSEAGRAAIVSLHVEGIMKYLGR